MAISTHGGHSKNGASAKIQHGPQRLTKEARKAVELIREAANLLKEADEILAGLRS